MSEEDALSYLTPEARARVEIDRMLDRSGWVVQRADRANLKAGRGVAVREFPLKPGYGRVDYMLFVDGAAVGVIEAKKKGETLTGVEWQSAKYREGLPEWVDAALERILPFAYESTGVETRFTSTLDPEPRSRPVFWFHRPETLMRWIGEWVEDNFAPTLRHRLRSLPALDERGLWPAQARAIGNLEASLAEDRPRALIQMATGSGKTYTAANVAYRLIKFAAAKRVLFLVDRANLGRQTLKEFQAFTTPDDGRKFTELYNVQHLSSNVIDPVSRVTVTTIQRLYSILKGEPELDPELDERSGYDLAPSEPVAVDYNASVPIEMFDVIVVDECHRSIYGVWRQVLDYFDAHIVGLTATPNKQAFGFFNQNLVMEYSHEEAVADQVNVDFDVYRIRTEITEHGGTIDAGLVTGFRDRRTRDMRWQLLDDEVTYGAQALDRAVVSKDQIRTVVRAFKERLFTEIFPGRSQVPKTLIFAKDDSHADDIVQIVREEFAKGDDFAVKITYKSTGRKPDEMIAELRNSYNPRIAVTVDMIATGTDVRPLECIFFMRAVKSRTYFEQMKGRGVRIIDETALQAVTPDAQAKTHFVIVDAVGVTDTDLADTQPLDREPTVPLEQLLKQVTFGSRDPQMISSIAGRIARLERRLSEADRAELEALAGARLRDLTHTIVEALDPDRHIQAASEAADGAKPTDEQIAAAAKRLLDEAVEPLVTRPELRERLVDIRRSYEQAIDEYSRDRVIEAGHSRDGLDRARATVDSFRAFIEEHKDEITALQVLYSRPYRERLTFKEIKELANAIERPPHRWTPEALWQAYETLDRSKVHGSGGRVLSDLVSLVRFALEQESELVPYPRLVDERFQAWLLQQENAGRTFTPEQFAWLERIRDHVAASLAIGPDDFEYAPFSQQGGLGKAYEVFGDELTPLLDELNETLVA
jgi:type I restriction enzyme R subunit